MKTHKTITAIVLSFVLTLFSFGILGMGVYSWYNGQAFSGKTMAYSRTLIIGSSSSNVVNYYGHIVGETLVYDVIDPVLGFSSGNLIPGSNIYLRTDLANESEDFSATVSLYLQNVNYDACLNDYLYFGISSPTLKRTTYKNSAIYDEVSETYTIKSIPLITSYVIAPEGTLSLYWYVRIDTDAGNDTMGAALSLGSISVGYSS